MDFFKGAQNYMIRFGRSGVMGARTSNGPSNEDAKSIRQKRPCDFLHSSDPENAITTTQQTAPAVAHASRRRAARHAALERLAFENESSANKGRSGHAQICSGLAAAPDRGLRMGLNRKTRTTSRRQPRR
jgi:hypothetical protein